MVYRLQKALEDTNLKLSAVATDIVGLSARAMLTALLRGETDPQVIAGLAHGKLRAKRAHLEAALVGQLQEQHRFVLSSQLAHIAFLEEQIAQCDAAIEQFLAQAASAPPAPDGGDHLSPSATPVAAESPATDAPAPASSMPLPYQQAVPLLDTLPGVNRRIAQIIVAEIGVDMGRFPSAAHLASWVGLCPGNHQSAGKQLHGSTRHGDRWLRQALIEAAQGAMRTKDSYLRA